MRHALPKHEYNNTDILRVKYRFNGGQRSVLFRKPAANSVEVHYGVVHGLLAGNTDCFTNDVEFYAADYQENGSTFSVPITWTTVTGTGGSGEVDPFRYPFFAGLSARSVGGVRCTWRFYGVAGMDGQPDAYRVSTASSAVWEAFWNDFHAATEDGHFVAIDGQPMFLNAYFNYGVNAYYQRKARRSA